MINCIEKWISNWKKNGWKLALGKPVKNKDVLTKLDDLCTKISVSWVIFICFFQRIFSFMFYQRKKFCILKDLRGWS
jgi:hypothetical protein